MSGRGTHYAGGAVAGLLVAQGGLSAQVWDLRVAVAVAVVATATSGGRLSPDADQYRGWRRLDRWVPDELLGHGGPLSHRGLSHWVAWGPIVAVLWPLLVWPTPAHEAWWVGVGVGTGWASHCALDYVYGKTVRSPEGLLLVHAGVPTVLWFRHRGGIWTSGGPGSRFAGVLLAGVAVGQAYVLATGGV